MLSDAIENQILLIEDNPGDRILIAEYIQEFFPTAQITEAPTFKAAEEFIIQHEGFTTILLDLSLPDKSGEELINSIIPLAGNCPVIVLTGYMDIDFGRKSVALGVSDYLIKDDLTAQTLYKSILYGIERKQRTIEIEESQQQYKNLFMRSPQPMWVYDVSTMQFLDVNEAASIQYGYSKEEFMSMTILQIRPAEEIPRLLQALSARQGDYSLKQMGIFKHMRKNGEIILVKIHSSGIFQSKKEYRLVLSEDVTESQNYLQAIEKQNASLREIAWIQSHLFRAPLARLMALVEVAREGSYDADLPQEKVFKFIAEAASELDELIKSITLKTDGIDLEIKNEG